MIIMYMSFTSSLSKLEFLDLYLSMKLLVVEYEHLYRPTYREIKVLSAKGLLC